MNSWLVLIPILSTIVGWICSWIACRVFLNKIIPRRQKELGQTIGKAANAAFSISDLEQKITAADNVKKVMPMVEAHIDDFLRNRLKEKMPVIGMFIGNKTIDSLKEVFLKEIEDLFPQVLKQFTGNLQSELNIETIIANKITNVSVAQWKKTLSPVLNYYQIAGAVTGFVIGIMNGIVFLIMK